MPCQDEKLHKILNLGFEISQIKDIDLLLEKILGEARMFTNSDAGSIYIKEGDCLRFKYAQNDTMQRRLSPGRKLPYSTFSVPIDNNSIAGSAAANSRSYSRTTSSSAAAGASGAGVGGVTAGAGSAAGAALSSSMPNSISCTTSSAGGAVTGGGAVGASATC